MRNEDVTHDQVGRFYDASVVTRFWSHLKQKQMHVGYWDDAHPFRYDLYEGAVRFTDYMISLTAVGEDGYFVDLGCGYGLPAVTLALRKNCRVAGITASKHQQETAERLAFENGLEGRVKFDVADANRLPFPDAAFDGGWFFESIFHIGHSSALEQASRVLKRDAEILIADFVKIGELADGEAEFLKKELGIASALTPDEYPDMLEKNGFRLIEFRDITDRTLDQEKRWGVHLELIDRREGDFFASLDRDELAYLKHFFTTLHGIAERAIGYFVVRAVRR